jgi:hypothetical protein
VALGVALEAVWQAFNALLLGAAAAATATTVAAAAALAEAGGFGVDRETARPFVGTSQTGGNCVRFIDM